MNEKENKEKRRHETKSLFIFTKKLNAKYRQILAPCLEYYGLTFFKVAAVQL